VGGDACEEGEFVEGFRRWRVRWFSRRIHRHKHIDSAQHFHKCFYGARYATHKPKASGT
jgi:hypothetical protein